MSTTSSLPAIQNQPPPGARMTGWRVTGSIRYTLGIWGRLTLFIDDAEVWLDNNRTERGLRGPVIGRRNHFGSKSPRGTQVAAIMYSLVESARASGIDPIAYLTEVATRAQRSPGAVLLPADLRAVTPTDLRLARAEHDP